MKSDYDVIIIGAGVAGMSAAIYLKRANLNIVMIENNAPGGQITKTGKIENYPGYSVVDGPTLAMSIFDQTQKLGVEYRYGHVIEIAKEDSYFKVKTDIEELSSRAVIIASGRKPKELGVTNEKKLAGRGISWCAICDGPLFKGKELVVIGGGNSALEEGLYLTEIGKKVTIIHRRDEFRGDKLLQEKILTNPKIAAIFNSEVLSFNEQDDQLASVTIKDKTTQITKTIRCEGAFIYIGFKPVSDMVKPFDLTDVAGYIITDDYQRTKVPRLYACGDVIKKEVYQIVTATAEGAKAALSAIKDLSQ